MSWLALSGLVLCSLAVHFWLFCAIHQMSDQLGLKAREFVHKIWWRLRCTYCSTAQCTTVHSSRLPSRVKLWVEFYFAIIAVCFSYDVLFSGCVRSALIFYAILSSILPDNCNPLSVLTDSSQRNKGTEKELFCSMNT